MISIECLTEEENIIVCGDCGPACHPDYGQDCSPEGYCPPDDGAYCSPVIWG